MAYLAGRSRIWGGGGGRLKITPTRQEREQQQKQKTKIVMWRFFKSLFFPAFFMLPRCRFCWLNCFPQRNVVNFNLKLHLFFVKEIFKPLWNIIILNRPIINKKGFFHHRHFASVECSVLESLADVSRFQ